MNALTDNLGKIANAKWFSNFILGTILAAAVVVGLQTSAGLEAKYGSLLHTLDLIILWIFTAEAAIKIAQYGKQGYKYFQDPWNVFDFIIVVVCFIPAENSQFAAVLRLARILRAMRLISAVPRLQLLVNCLLKSIPSMGYVGILLFLLFYVYAVMGVFLFRENDPVHFADLGTSLLTLFRVVTLEDWTDVMYIQMYGFANYTGDGFNPSQKHMPILGAGYFVSFVMIGTMIMLNLFIGVIISSMDEAQDEQEKDELIEARQEGRGLTTAQYVQSLEHDLDSLREHLRDLRLKLETQQEMREQQNSTTDESPPTSA